MSIITSTHHSSTDRQDGRDFVKAWIINKALSLGFSDCGFVSVYHPTFKEQTFRLKQWLNHGLHADLAFLEENHHLRANPALLVDGARTIISVRMDYLHEPPKPHIIEDNTRPNHAIIARYARGRDYHKTLRQKLKQLALAITHELPSWHGLGVGAEDGFVFRPFSDSAPIFEKAIAHHAGLGWEGKHTLLINRHGGSFFNLGELFVSLCLADDNASIPVKNLCGSCSACMDICPTHAIIAPSTLDAKACIAYLTIEHKGAIDVMYRKAIGNRIFGCDDCQLICPWNKFAKVTSPLDYAPRHGLDNITLRQVWAWSEDEFLIKSEGSALRRTGYIGILRNTAIALGNCHPTDDDERRLILASLADRLGINAMLDEHILWAIQELQSPSLP